MVGCGPQCRWNPGEGLAGTGYRESDIGGACRHGQGIFPEAPVQPRREPKADVLGQRRRGVNPRLKYPKWGCIYGLARWHAPGIGAT